jgi:uncharacterized membrane protein YgcG
MSGQRNNSGGGGGWGVVILVLLAIAAVVWLLSTVGHFLGLTPTWSEITDKPDGWVGERYSGVFMGYVLTVTALGVAALLTWFGLAATSAEEGLKATASRRLRPTIYAAITIAIAIVALPIGPKDAPQQPAETASAQEPATSPDSSDSTSLAEAAADDEARERRRIKKARAKRRARRERRERRERKEEAQLLSQTGDEDGDSSAACHPSYDPCVPPGPPDLDCPDVGGPVSVSGDDPHGLDRDRDGMGCEANSGGAGSSSSGGEDSSSSDGSSSSGSGPSTTNWCGKRDGDGDGIYCE